MIFNHYQTIRHWQPDFDPEQDNLWNLLGLIWLWIPCLRIEYFDQRFLIRLGGKNEDRQVDKSR